MADLSSLLSQMVQDEEKLYLLKNRDLITEDNFTVLQNDNGSTVIKVIMPMTLGGITITPQGSSVPYNFYIDYIDGAGKPGVVANDTITVEKIYKQLFTRSESHIPEVTDSSFVKITGGRFDGETNTIIFTDNEESVEIKLEDIVDNRVDYTFVDEEHPENNETVTYIIETNTKYSKDGRTYTSLIHNQNYEDSAEISKDYPSEYSDILYFIKQSPNLSVGTAAQFTKQLICEAVVNEDSIEIYHNGELISSTLINDVLYITWEEYLLTASKPTQSGPITFYGNPIDYMYFEWKIDKQITNSPGEVSFSIRIEDEDGFIYQSNPATFKVVSNLKETYYLKKEIEENYVIQNRTIKPVGNFENVLVKGDTNSNKLFYKMNRYFQGQDILEKRKYNNKEVYKNEYGVYGYKDVGIGSTTYQVLNIQYVVNDLSIYNLANNAVGSYDPITQIIKIEDKEYKFNSSGAIAKVAYKPSGEYCYKYHYEIYLCKKINEEWNLITPVPILDNLSGTITLDGVEYYINIDALGTNFITPVLDQFDVTKEYLVPVFNRLIRFNFMSPNKDYGDSNDGEIEYINDEEQYFIFSWTPDARVTRVAGDVSYYIEFYINGSFEKAIGNSEVTTVRTKSYSWSTLPTTIKVEQNEAGTASADYLPHWVSYLENNLQDDMDAFLNSDLQSQYNSLEEYLLYTFLGDYFTAVSRQEIINGEKVITIGDIQYIVSITKEIINEKIVYRVVLINEAKGLAYSFNCVELRDGVYGAATQININPINIIDSISYNGTSLQFSVDSENDKITIIYQDDDTYEHTPIPTNRVDTLSFTNSQDNTIICDITYKDFVNNYFFIYNETTTILTAYKLNNDSGVPVPILTAAQANLDAWNSNATAQLNIQSESYQNLLEQINTAFGIDSNTTSSLYTRILSLFNQLGNTLRYYYDGNNGSLFTIYIKDNSLTTDNVTEINLQNQNELLTFTYGNVQYFAQVISDINNQQRLDINEDVEKLFAINTYYIENPENPNEYILYEGAYDNSLTYYDDDQGTITHPFYTYLIYGTTADSQYTQFVDNPGLTCQIFYNNLYNVIQEEIETAAASAKEAYDIYVNTLDNETIPDIKQSIEDEYAEKDGFLTQSVANQLTDLQNVFAAMTNAGLLNDVEILTTENNLLVSKNTEITNAFIQANTLIIQTNNE